MTTKAQLQAQINELQAQLDAMPDELETHRHYDKPKHTESYFF